MKLVEEDKQNSCGSRIKDLKSSIFALRKNNRTIGRPEKDIRNNHAFCGYTDHFAFLGKLFRNLGSDSMPRVASRIGDLEVSYMIGDHAEESAMSKCSSRANRCNFIFISKGSLRGG